jgi:hypothetical protein
MGGAGLTDRYQVFDDMTSATVWLLIGGSAGVGEPSMSESSMSRIA